MKSMREHLQMYMKNKTTHLQVSNWQREKKNEKNCHHSVRYNTRELNKICSGNLYPFSPESIMEHILAPTNEAD